MIQTEKRCEKMSNLVRRSCFLNKRCDRMIAKKDAVSCFEGNRLLLESGISFGSSRQKRGVTGGAAPCILGKDEVASSNLASSSIKTSKSNDVEVFIYPWTDLKDQSKHAGGMLLATAGRSETIILRSKM